MNDQDFVVGDVLQLRSGGQKMVVFKINHEGIHVNWFDAQIKLRSAIFAQSERKALVIVPLPHPYRDTP